MFTILLSIYAIVVSVCSAKVTVFDGFSCVYIDGNFFFFVDLAEILLTDCLTCHLYSVNDVFTCHSSGDNGAYMKSQSSHATKQGCGGTCGKSCHVQLLECEDKPY